VRAEIGLLLTRAVLAVVLGAAGAAHAQPLGPAPRGPDGRFLNLAGDIPHAGPLVTLPFFFRRIGTTLRSRSGGPTRRENDGTFLRENAGHSVPTVTWVGHSTLIVQIEHTTFLTDPTWSKTASPFSWIGPRRFVEPGVALDALPPIDFVLISHNHYDHLDLGTLREISRRHPRARFLVPLGNAKLLNENGIDSVEELDWGERARVGKLTIHCLPAQHWSRRGLLDARKALWASWAVTGSDRRFYFAGDTGFSDDFVRVGAALGPFDLAALPIGAYKPVAMMRPWHLDPEEAVRAGLDLRAQRLIGIHFGTFDLTDEPLDEPPRRFRAAAEGAGLDAEDAWLLEVGETRTF
jgi:N-acyl-phosphatidylethanolamine-hydrolysing phospholipase D